MPSMPHEPQVSMSIVSNITPVKYNTQRLPIQKTTRSSLNERVIRRTVEQVPVVIICYSQAPRLGEGLQVKAPTGPHLLCPSSDIGTSSRTHAARVFRQQVCAG